MFRINLAAVLLMVVAVVGGSLVGTVHAAGKVAFVIDVGGKALCSPFGGCRHRRLENLRSLTR